ncbi:unnamed protein product [Rotaria sp. Silwood1]|nr:unnamed protein product [Rotaria sp. Silwood1]CAF3368933.1 unnamed protein product [Rotaria sp. Silwood1]CAF3369099.1 unnamed protein product [Rotaria sp. Silwood1]CAF3373041.1 unnamed protein product [Rotaria sp. Silwood1]CAF4560642.1 unnamed protein product [Rotaria sp. Silwood1]
MLFPLVYFLVAFFVYILLYEYYKNNTRKQIAELDFLQNLESIQFKPIPISTTKSFNEIKTELRTNFHFNCVRIIFGIDFSASNEWQGRKTFNGQLLHKTNSNKIYNPYQKAISELGIIFEDIFPSKVEYCCFGFGDETTKDYSFFPIDGGHEEFNNYQSVLDAYLEKTKNVVLGGPTGFTPLIQQLISYGIHCRKDFSMLVILTDELKISHEDNSLMELIYTLTNLSNTCLLVIGVGDGPWQRMSYEEQRLRELAFKKRNEKKKQIRHGIIESNVVYDNFHFVDFNSFISKSDKNTNENYLARAILKKLPLHLKQAFKNDDNIAHF